MLKTNTKQAKKNLENYIINNFQDYEGNESKDLKYISNYILNTLYDEKLKHLASKPRSYYSNLFECFKDWAQGLPTILNTCYYYNISAVDTLGSILEETEEEKNIFDEEQAEEKMTYLLFRTITENAKEKYYKLINLFY